jgi:bla regulator protein BlaR1
MSAGIGLLSNLTVEALELLLVTSAACMVILLLRRPVRAAFGARVTYALWWLLPAAVLAVLLPAPSIAPNTLVLDQVTAAFGAPAAIQAAAAPAALGMADLWTTLALIWLTGCLCAVVTMVVQQFRFRRGLGALQPLRDDLWKAETSEGLPAVLGLRARIVLPQDFEDRYGPEQQALVLAHERVHARRGDVYWNLGFALLCALQWFNPLLRLAQRAFRLDQELACDARVLALNPGSRRSYGEALLGSSSAYPAAPLGCPAFGTHPLKERITMLTRPLPSLKRLLTGFTLCLGLGTGFAGLAWAQQNPRLVDAELLDIQMKVSIDKGPTHTPRMITPAGEEFGLRLEAPDGQIWSIDLTAQQSENGQIEVSGHIKRGSELAASPSLKLGEGKPGRVALENPDGSERFSLELTAKAEVAETSLQPVVPELPSTPTATMPAKAISSTRPLPVVESLPPQGDDTEVAYRQLHPPKYPRDAVEQRLQGDVLVQVEVLSDGAAGQLSVSVSSGSGLLDEAALEAVSKWQFHPAKRAGTPIVSSIQVPVRFSLDETGAGASTGDPTSYRAPSYRRLSPPEYPQSAKTQGLQGTTLLQVGLDEAGTVQTVNIVDSTGTDLLDRAASAAVERWTFNPATREGRAVPSQVLVPVQFLASNGTAEPYAPPAGALETITLRAD